VEQQAESHHLLVVHSTLLVHYLPELKLLSWVNGVLNSGADSASVDVKSGKITVDNTKSNEAEHELEMQKIKNNLVHQSVNNWH
jgi:hypothetical protein